MHCYVYTCQTTQRSLTWYLCSRSQLVISGTSPCISGFFWWVTSRTSVWGRRILESLWKTKHVNLISSIEVVTRLHSHHQHLLPIFISSRPSNSIPGMSINLTSQSPHQWSPNTHAVTPCSSPHSIDQSTILWIALLIRERDGRSFSWLGNPYITFYLGFEISHIFVCKSRPLLVTAT